VRAPDGRFEGIWARTFAEVDSGEVLLFEDSSGALALAVSGGDAAGLMNLTADGEVRLRPLK
jgi:S-adenosylmethionine hydrolase